MHALLGLLALAALAAIAPSAAAGGGSQAAPVEHPRQQPDPGRQGSEHKVEQLADLTIVALGDSLTAGYRLAKREAYPALLQERLTEAGLPFTVVNHGMSGDTSAGGVRRLDAALRERPQVLIVAFGANDGLRGVPVAEVRANLARIIETAQAGGVAVLLCGMEALPLYGWQYTLDFHQIFPDLAAKYQVPLVPFLLNGVIGNPDLMSSDGVHPNAAGARVLAANIWPKLEPLARQVAAGVTPAGRPPRPSPTTGGSSD